MTTDELRGGNDCLFMSNPFKPGGKGPIRATASYKYKPNGDTAPLLSLPIYIFAPLAFPGK